MMISMERSSQIKAASSEQRIRILQLLADPKEHFGFQWSADPEKFGVCMSLIAEALEVSQPTISRHLDILKQAGFITVKRHQKWSYCQRDEAKIAEFAAWMAEALQAQPVS